MQEQSCQSFTQRTVVPGPTRRKSSCKTDLLKSAQLDCNRFNFNPVLVQPDHLTPM